MENLSAADIAAVNRSNCGDGFGFGGEGLWLFAILALMGGGFGGWNRGKDCATTEDVASGFSFSALQNKTNEILSAINGANTNLNNAICQLGYTNLQNFNALERQLADCCCTTQRAVDSVKFDMANYAASTNTAISNGIQKVLDKMSADREAALQGRIQQLELQQAMCGVIRYPTATTYAAGNPFLNCGCGTNI